MTTLKKLRPYPLCHQWVLWHERYVSRSSLRTQVLMGNSGSSGATPNQRTEIEEINTVQRFWQVFNNTPFSNLLPNDWLHLFKKDVKPIWYPALLPQVRCTAQKETVVDGMVY